MPEAMCMYSMQCLYIFVGMHCIGILSSVLLQQTPKYSILLKHTAMALGIEHTYT